MSQQVSLSVSKTFKSSDGTPIYCDATGDPLKPALVFIHGISGSSIYYDDLFRDERLLEQYFLVRILSSCLCAYLAQYYYLCDIHVGSLRPARTWTEWKAGDA